MSRLLFDLEANGLTPDKVWCVSTLDVDTMKRKSYEPSELGAALVDLAAADTLIGHNIMAYDLEVIKDLYGVDLYHKELIDTLTLSRLYNPTREGGHSLEAWGYSLGYPKVEHEEWDAYSKDMLHRCEQDVELNYKVYVKLNNLGRNFSQDSRDLEHRVARIIDEQVKNGWLFKVKEAELLLAKIEDEVGEIEDTVRQTFLPKQKFVKTVTPKLRNNGELSKSGLTTEEYLARQATKDTTPFDRTKTVIFNLASRNHIGEWLVDFSWKPTVFTPKSNKPEINEKTLEGVDDIPEVALILHYLTIVKVRAFLTNWLSKVDYNDRLHCYVNTMGAVTGRMTHSDPNLGQVPSAKKLYGKECRSLFTVPEGYTLVGMDAAALELRMLAHYVDVDTFTKAACEGTEADGTDVHSVNRDLAKLDTRDQAKTMYYALIYGSGDAKMGSIINGSVKEGRELKALYFHRLPELGNLIERVREAAIKGYLKGIDGRLIKVRQIYSALNTLLQGGGAVVMKRALVILYDKATKAGLDFKFVGNIHDEIQAEVADADVETYSAFALEAMVEAGEYYNMRCPLEGTVKSGASWADTH